MPLDTSAFTETVNAVLPLADKENSVLTRLGASPISTDITNIYQPVVGNAGIVGEKGVKPSTAVTIPDWQTTRFKFVNGVRFTDEFERADTGRALLAQVATGFATNIPVSYDQVILYGVDPATGLAPVSNRNVVLPGSILADGEEEPMTGTFEAALNAAMGSQWDANGIALSRQGFGELASITTTSGEYKYPNLNRYGVFNYRWLQAAVAEVVSTKGDAKTDTTVRGIVGDYTKILRAVRALKTEVIPYGNPDGLGDLSATNEQYLRTEFEAVFVVLDYSKFTVITDAP